MLSNIELGKAKLALFAPEFISLTAKLTFVASDKVPTAGTDGRRVFYNPTWVDSLPVPQVVGLILHEVGHNMLAHPARLGTRDMRLANIAMDIVLNQSLQSYFEETKQKLGAEFPPGDLTPGPKWAKYKGWNWEKVYDDLLQNAPKVQQFDFVEAGKNEDGSDMTASEKEALAKEWTMAAQQAATMAKSRGVGSAFFEEFIADIIKPRVNWQAFLWDAFKKSAKDDQSWRRFHRKLIPFEIYMPGMYSEVLDHVLFAVDTSGSMDSEEFKVALGAINEIMETVKPQRITFIQNDTSIKSIEELTPEDLPLAAKAFKGRGGTTLTPIFDFVKSLDEVPDLVVVLTDGEFESGGISKDLEPACPTVWLVTTAAVIAAENSFGAVLRVEV